MRQGFSAVVFAVIIAVMGVHDAPAVQPDEIRAPETLETLPDALKPWVPWVLGNVDHVPCPSAYNNAAQKACAWPTALALDVSGKGGTFTMDATLFDEGWLPLPGNGKYWPQDVVLQVENGAPLTVAEQQGNPAVFLPAGQYRISGKFYWDALPDTLQLPAGNGLVTLSVAGAVRPYTEIDAARRLWLRNPQEAGAVSVKGDADRMTMDVYRKVTDSIPLMVETHVTLNVAGKPREEVLKGMLPDGFTPMAMETSLPSRLEADGTLRLLVRPGRWDVRVTSYHVKPLDALQLPKALPGKSTQEIWAFEGQSALRVVQVEGVEAIDPSQTEMPGHWRNLPAYMMKPDSEMQLTVKKRGLEELDPDSLYLERIWRLDGEGGGYTVEDRFSGDVNRSWRLNALPETQLGKVDINGQSQFITTLDGKKEGVEVRPGNLFMEAESRFISGIRTLPAIGWEHDVKSLRGELRLPAGWSLFAASGVDSVSESWIKNWTLLDVFLVLVAIVATARLLGVGTGIVIAAALVLLHPELPFVTGAALTILAAMGLLRVLPAGKFRLSVQMLRRATLLAFLIAALPFMVDHIRVSLYPQLAMEQSIYGGQMMGYDGNVGNNMAEMATMRAAKPVMAPAPYANEDMAAGYAVTDMSRAVEKKAMSSGIVPAQKEMREMVQQLYQYDPNNKVQTGYGVPERQSNMVELNWNGPVKSDHNFTVWLMSPTLNLVLAIGRVLLLALLFVMLLGIPLDKLRRAPLSRQAVQAFCVLLTLGSLTLAISPAIADDDVVYPPEGLLQELRGRLIREMEKAPDCAPSCATLARSRFITSSGELTLYLQFHAGEGEVIVPLPGNVRNWRPSQVTVDGTPALHVREGGSGYLELVLPAGVHDVVLRGAMPSSSESLNLTFPIRPYYVDATGSGWEVQGIRANGDNDGNFQLTRTAGKQAPSSSSSEQTLESRPLPAFFSVERTIDLGLSWRVHTVIQRLTPVGKGETLAIPLLPGESLLTGDIEVKGDKAIVHLGAQEHSRTLESSLAQQDKLTLQAAADTNWVEVWKLNASNIWHVEMDGLVRTHTGAQAAMPVWHPWPGESVIIAVSLPKGVEGATRTIDRTSLSVTVGERSSRVNLGMQLRSSQGGLHQIKLPEGAELQSLFINGRTEPSQLKDGMLTLPVAPGTQQVDVEWTLSQGISSHVTVPEVDVQLPTVNSDISIALPEDRWVLFTHGPHMGPAVLIWGWVPVILLIAFGLARIPGVPLRSWHWFLLLLGLTQTNLWIMAIVSGWLVALAWRRQQPESDKAVWFNLRQIVLGGWTLASLLLLFYGIKHGLLGSPDMKIAGNNSYAFLLNWYQDITGSVLPRPGVLSLPLMAYRTLMLLWALWLAFALVRWLKWGWDSFSTGGYWKRYPRKKDEGKVAQVEA